MSNTFGQLLNKVRSCKYASTISARSELWQRNNVSANSPGFELRESEYTTPSGTQVIELRLWKLVDATTITLGSEVTETIETGVQSLHDFHSDPTHPSYYQPVKEGDVW